MRHPQRILLVRFSHLGDVVHALGVFHALHAAFPSAEIAWAVQGEFAELIAGLPGLARTLAFERRGGLGAWLRLWAELRRFGPDWTIDAQGNTKSAVAAWLSRAPRRVAPHRADWQEGWAAWSANERAPALVPPARHAVQRMEALARHLVPDLTLPLRLDAALTPAELARGEGELEARLLGARSPPVLLHLSSPEDVRGWPRERWRELIQALGARDRTALVLSGPSEAELGRTLADAVRAPRVVHWVAQRGLRALAALFTAAAKRGGVLVACDSGPMHLAAAHGLAVVALEGPQDAARTGPWPFATLDERDPGRHRAVRSRRELPCAPCLSKRCRHPEGPVCMQSLGADQVLAALEAAQ